MICPSVSRDVNGRDKADDGQVVKLTKYKGGSAEWVEPSVF